MCSLLYFTFEFYLRVFIKPLCSKKKEEGEGKGWGREKISFDRWFQIIFHSNCINLYFHQRLMGIPVSSQFHQHLIFYVLILPPVVSICIYMLTDEIERHWPLIYPPVYFLKSVFKSLSDFLLGYLSFSFLFYMISLWFFECKSFFTSVFFNIFQYSLACFFFCS